MDVPAKGRDLLYKTGRDELVWGEIDTSSTLSTA